MGSRGSILASRAHGYTEGLNIKIEYRFGDGNPERFTALLSELVSLKPAVILAVSNAAIMAAVKATQTIPLIGFTASDTSMATGKIASFAHPGANAPPALSREGRQPIPVSR